VDTDVIFSDDVIFRQGKKGIFQIVVLLNDIFEPDEARVSLRNLGESSDNYVISEEATFIIQDSEPRRHSGVGTDVFRLATAAEFTSSSLCKGRPEPEHYDMYKLKRALHGKRYAIVRQDRFVYAACNTKDELERICGGIQQTLGLA
jgi:hypothetical protein